MALAVIPKLPRADHQLEPPQHEKPQASKMNEMNAEQEDEWAESRKSNDAIIVVKGFRPVNEFLSSGKMVKVVVGSERKEWTLHEDLLCDRSEYFKSAFQGGFKEATEKEIYLEEEDPEAFALFVDWIYGSNLHIEFKNNVRELLRASDRKPELETASLYPLIKLYCLAEFLCIETLMNSVMSIYMVALRQINQPVALWVVDYVAEHSPPTSFLRKFVTRFVASYMILVEARKNKYDAALKRNPEFAFEVLKAMQFYHFCSPEEQISPLNERDCVHHSHLTTPRCRRMIVGACEIDKLEW